MRRRDVLSALLASAAAPAQRSRALAPSRAAGIYPQTAAERGAGIVPIDTACSPGRPDRYSANKLPGITDMREGFDIAARQALRAGGAPVQIGSVLALGSSVTLPVNAPVVFTGSGLIDIATGVSLTIKGPMFGARIQVFNANGNASSGAVVLAGSAGPEVYPEWWGCHADSSPGRVGTDNTEALAACITAAAGGAGLNVGLVPIALSAGYYSTGNQVLPPATCIRGVGRAQCGFIASPGTAGQPSGNSAGAWFTDNGNAAKIILEDFALYAQHSDCPYMVYALRLGYNGVNHGTEGYLRGLWIRDCACFSNGFQCDIAGDVGMYDLLSIYCNNLFQQSGIRFMGGAGNMCSQLVSMAAGGENAPPWEPGETYVPGRFANFGGRNYLCAARNTNIPPPTPGFWSAYTRRPQTYAVYLDSPAMVIAGMEIEAPASGAVALSIQQNADISGVLFSLADGAALDHVWELGPSATHWRMAGVNFANGRANSALVRGGNARRADGSFFAGNATGQGVAWSASVRYCAGQIVNHLDVVYLCMVANLGRPPPNAAYWNVYIADVRRQPQKAGEGDWFSDSGPR